MRASCAPSGAVAGRRPPCALSAALGLPVRSRALPRRQLLCARVPALCAGAGAGGDAEGNAAKRVYVSRGQREGRPAPDLRSVRSRAPRLSGNAFQRSKQLTDALGACASGEEVLALVASRLVPGAEPLDAYNITAALSRLSKLQPSGLAGNTRFAALLSAAEALLDEMQPRSLANLLYALGQLRATLSDSWMARYWAASEGKLAFCDPQQLSNTIYACAKLGASPPASWMDAFWRASLAQMGQFKPQEFSNVLWASGKINLPPPAGWIERYWEASEDKLASFKEQELSNALYVCGQLGIMPPAGWLERFWEVSEGKLASFKSQELSNTLYACGQLGITPPADWLHRFWEASEDKLASFNEQNFSNTLYACGQLGITPPAGWMHEFWRASLPKLGQFSEQALANLLYACGLLARQPEPDWLQRFWEATEGKLDSFTPQGCANSLHAVAILQLWDCPVIGALWTKLVAAAASPSSPERMLLARELYQVHLGAQSERPGLLPPPGAEVLEFARDAWVKDVKAHSQKSELHRSVSECLTAAGIEHENERWCEDSGHSIDIVIESGAHRIALEVDGFFHFLHSGQQTGPTRLRDRLLRAHGWRVAALDGCHWRDHLSEPEKRAHLMGLLAAAAAPAA